jgi:hypothetical protein
MERGSSARNASLPFALSDVAITQPLSKVTSARAESAQARRRVSLRNIATEIALFTSYILLLAATPIVIGVIAASRGLRRLFAD